MLYRLTFHLSAKMMPAGAISFLVCLLFVGSQAEDKARGDWLCAQVREHQKKHPFSNVIAFASGDFRLNGPIDAVDLVYEVNGCGRGVGGLGTAMIGGTVGDIANTVGPAVLPGAGKKIGDAVINYINPCRKFKMVAFADGSVTRRGDGGFENWCFVGEMPFPSLTQLGQRLRDTFASPSVSCS